MQPVSAHFLADFHAPPPTARLWGREAKLIHEVPAPTGQENEQNAERLYLLGLDYCEQGDLPRAVQVLARANDLCQANLGQENPVTLSTVRNLANVYQVALDQAAPAVERREKARTSQLTVVRYRGPDHPPRKDGEVQVAARHWKEAAHQLGRQIVAAPPGEIKQHVVPVLTQALRRSPSPEERVALVRALGELGPTAGEAVPLLTWCVKNARTPAERQAAVQALGQMGPAARPAVSALVEGLASPDPAFRGAVCQALVELGPVARTATSPEFVSRIDRDARTNAPLAREVLKQLAGQDGRIGVSDGAECFRIPTLRFATGTIRQLARARNLEVLVETVAGETGENKDCNSDAVCRMGPNSLYVRIVKNPPQVHLVASPALAAQKLPLQEWEKELTARVRKHDYDMGLCQFLQSLRAAEPARSSTSAGSSGR
jgi:hypothetical protein